MRRDGVVGPGRADLKRDAAFVRVDWWGIGRPRVPGTGSGAGIARETARATLYRDAERHGGAAGA